MPIVVVIKFDPIHIKTSVKIPVIFPTIYFFNIHENSAWSFDRYGAQHIARGKQGLDNEYLFDNTI